MVPADHMPSTTDPTLRFSRWGTTAEQLLEQHVLSQPCCLPGVIGAQYLKKKIIKNNT